MLLLTTNAALSFPSHTPQGEVTFAGNSPTPQFLRRFTGYVEQVCPACCTCCACYADSGSGLRTWSVCVCARL